MTKEHIIYTLGINVPTLTESLNGNKNSLQLIMEEQMLYESFLDSVKAYAKEKWGKVITTIKDWKDAAVAIGKIINSKRLQFLSQEVFYAGIKLKIRSLEELLKKLGLSELYTKYVVPIVDKVKKLTGWKGFLVTLGIGSVISYITSKLSTLSAEGIKKWILAYFSDGIIEKIISKLTDFSSFIGWLQPIIKGTEIIVDILKKSLNQIEKDDEIDQILSNPSTANESFNTYNKSKKMKNEALKKLIKEEILNILELEAAPTAAPAKKNPAEVQILIGYLQGTGKSALQQINNPAELKQILDAIWSGMNPAIQKNSLAISVKKVADMKL